MIGPQGQVISDVEAKLLQNEDDENVLIISYQRHRKVTYLAL